MIFVSFALVLILFEVVRGWRLGVVRQAVRLLALVAAYAAAFLGGRMLLPLLRPFLRVPDLFISILAGAILASDLRGRTAPRAILFKRTAAKPHRAPALRVAARRLGFFRPFSVWLVWSRPFVGRS